MSENTFKLFKALWSVRHWLSHKCCQHQWNEIYFPTPL